MEAELKGYILVVEAKDTQMRVEKHLQAAKNLTENGHSDSPNKSQLTLSHGVVERGVVVDEYDNQ